MPVAGDFGYCDDMIHSARNVCGINLGNMVKKNLSGVKKKKKEKWGKKKSPWGLTGWDPKTEVCGQTSKPLRAHKHEISTWLKPNKYLKNKPVQTTAWAAGACRVQTDISNRHLKGSASLRQQDVPDKGEIEADGQLEIQLDGGTLVVPADGILDLNVNLQGRWIGAQREINCFVQLLG